MTDRSEKQLQRKKILLLFIFFPCILSAQTNENGKKSIWDKFSLQGTYQNGYVFPTNDFIRGNNAQEDAINVFHAYTLKFSRQTTGEKQWEQLYKYPNYGIGFYFADFHNPKEIGFPFGIYGFLNAPFKRWENFTFNYELGFGVLFNWKPFDPLTNNYNIAIGASQSCIIDAGLNLQYNLTQNIVFETGFSFTHFSNGALKKPNLGINTIAPKVSLKYSFYKKPVFTIQEIPKFEKQSEWTFSLFTGTKNVIFDSVNIEIREKYEGMFFPVFGFSGIYNRQIGYKSKLGLGMSCSYNGSVNAQVAVEEDELEAVDGPFTDKLQISIYPSYELVVNKVSLVLQPSFYLYRRKLTNQSPVFHQKVGIKYHFTDKIFMGITLRAYHFHVSDFVEWSIGYRIKSK
ncbi:MAG: acyloxyacyl hydrolase [Mariniphaga sp.]|nr:acyloxyacyl hydrolase [Mariniphaga sp.]MDD4754834.1 acyloxyacyl hydrolase [Prolixibacteraceae bacterium]